MSRSTGSHSPDHNSQKVNQRSAADTVKKLGFDEEIRRLQETIVTWIRSSSTELRAYLEWQFGDRSKYFRPFTVFSCYRATTEHPVPQGIIVAAAVVEMFHNVSLVIDDILDNSEHRRGKPALHFCFGLLPALMTSGYVVAEGYRIVAHDPFQMGLFCELMKRLSIAECMQWRLRRQPLGVEDWLKIAAEDTGSMFEICACLGTRNESLRRFGHLLGVLYHGCDDVGDARSLKALGGGGEEDLRDGILTLPAAFAIRDPRIARLFCQESPSAADLEEVSRAIFSRLPEAEEYLDAIAEKASEQAMLCARDASVLLTLVDETRDLARR